MMVQIKPPINVPIINAIKTFILTNSSSLKLNSFSLGVLGDFPLTGEFVYTNSMLA